MSRRERILHAMANMIAADWRLRLLGYRFCPHCGTITAAGAGPWVFCSQPHCEARR